MGTTLITGASAGLGEGFARAFAARGESLILTARRGERLEALAGELRAQHAGAVEVIALDLAAPGAVGQLMQAISERGLAVDTLVNNAGFGAAGAFNAMDPAMLERMIALNCTALMGLCRAVLPGMVQMRRGGILNVASTAAFQPGPYMAAYYATKAFVLSFSEALHEEVRGTGVRVAALCPGPTRTEFFDVADMTGKSALTRFAADADGVVADGIAALDRNRAVRISGMTNRIAAASTRVTPRWLLRRIVATIQRDRSG